MSYQNFPFVKQNYENLALFDGGWILPVTEQLLNGKKIYTEVNYAYGIIPVGIYFVFAHIFGNTPLCLFWVTGIIQILNMLLIFFVLKRYSNIVFSYTVLLLLIVPVCFDKGISYTSPTPYEIMYLTSLTMVWKPFESRSKRRSIIIGCYLIVPYFIKFGSHLIAGLTIIMIDLAYYFLNNTKKEIYFSLFIRKQLYIGIGFFSSTVVLILGCIFYFPHEMALEFLWPYFRVIQYKKEFVHMTTFPIYHNIGFFLGIQLPIIFVLALSTWTFFKNLNNIQQKEWNLMILTVFYLISCFIYFKNESYFYHYSWIAFIPAILINKLGFRLQIIFFIITLPIAINHARGVYGNMKMYESGKYHLIDTPSQDKLYFTDKQKRSFFQLRDALITLKSEKNYSNEQSSIFVSGWSFGVAHFLNYSHASRHIFVISEEIRPYEQTQIVDQWLRHNFAFVQPRKYYGNININNEIGRLEVFSNSFDLSDFNKKRILSNTLESVITDDWVIFPVIPSQNQKII